MAGNLRGVAEEGEERTGEEDASATTYFFSPDSCPTVGEGTPGQLHSAKVRYTIATSWS